MNCKVVYTVETVIASALPNKGQIMPEKKDTYDGTNGFTAELRQICRNTCSEFGEPPCYDLPNLIQPCENISPCKECILESNK